MSVSLSTVLLWKAFVFDKWVHSEFLYFHLHESREIYMKSIEQMESHGWQSQHLSRDDTAHRGGHQLSFDLLKVRVVCGAMEWWKHIDYFCCCLNLREVPLPHCMVCSHCVQKQLAHSEWQSWSKRVHGAPVKVLIPLEGPAAVSKLFAHLPNHVFWSPRFFTISSAPGLSWMKEDWVFSVLWAVFSPSLFVYWVGGRIYVIETFYMWSIEYFVLVLLI